MKKNKILALTILALGIIYLLISLSLVLGRHTDKTDTSNSNQTGEETSANITDATSSNDNSTNTCEHLLSTEWSFENGQHFHKCTLNNCSFTDTKIPCSGGNATCMQQAVCQFCNSAYGNLSDHVWTNEWDYSTSNGHAHKCSFGCDQHSEIQPHVPGPAATENSPQICTECNYVIAPATKHIHTLEKIASQSSTCTEKGNIEYFACVECSKIFYDALASQEITDPNAINTAPLGHDFAAATCLDAKKCQRASCNAIEGSALGHHFKDGLVSNADFHWRECSVCAQRVEQVPHVLGPAATEKSPQLCKDCGYVIAPALNHTHSFVKIVAKEPSCVQSGNIEHFVCTECAKCFFDAEATREITGNDSVNIAPLGHDFTLATCTTPKSCRRAGCNITQGTALGHTPNAIWNSNADSHWHSCTTCGERLDLTPHTKGPEATEHAPQVCTDCNYVISPKLNHVHSLIKIIAQSATCTQNGNIEYFVCSGCSKYFKDISAKNEISDIASVISPSLGHDFAPATCTTPKSCQRTGCNATEGVALGHTPTDTWNSNADSHWRLCSACGEHLNKAQHTKGPAATEQAPQICTECGYVVAPKLEHVHKFDSDIKYDSVSHWYECVCGQVGNDQTHSDANQDSKCDACQYQMPSTPSESPDTSNKFDDEPDKMEGILRPAQITLLRPVASGILTKSNSSAIIDYSNFKDGYVMVKYTVDTNIKLKVQVQGPTTTYTYNIYPQEWTVFPLSDGNGDYNIKVFKNVADNRYSTVLSLKFKATLSDEFAPFLRPNQYVNYENATNTMNKAAELAAGKSDTLEKVKAIYNYVITNISYDYAKAATVQSGYLPDLDQVLADKKGICFDYASLMAGMLRSQNIACKLVVGYANTEYHAWISVWTPEKGWVDGAIFFDGVKWQMMDPTYASSAGSDIINKVTYTSKYIY